MLQPNRHLNHGWQSFSLGITLGYQPIWPLYPIAERQGVAPHQTKPALGEAQRRSDLLEVTPSFRINTDTFRYYANSVFHILAAELSSRNQEMHTVSLSPLWHPKTRPMMLLVHL
ncbi:hypothetical protein EVAR_73590_1 [Eumeta japonica]|uniref:Uncharacterized protein n=1 Tax=Eumeta variegata TaxID=151549 RepID=A0A4C1TMR4_EUMVA|nr:hypothetical protein EVAR_73590_1 [Eumeta japonica]